jgi:acetylglutamate kinase
MNPLDAQITKSAVLLEALPYMQSFRGCTFLIKVGGSAMEDPVQVDSFLRDVVFLEAVGINPVIVHGGGKAISKAMTESGLQAKFINGMRVTDDETIKIVEETLARVINPEIVTKINAFGGKAVGIPGTEVFLGEKMKGDLGWVGEVNDCKLGLIQAAVAGEFVPVVSPVARELASGKTLNVNADLAACGLAKRLKATKLIFLSDVRGVMRDPKDDSTLIPSLDEAQHHQAEGRRHHQRRHDPESGLLARLAPRRRGQSPPHRRPPAACVDPRNLHRRRHRHGNPFVRR